MNVTGQLVAANVKSSSGTVRSKIGCRNYGVELLDDLRPRVRYRTPADVRAIPNEQWEAWFIALDFPWADFSPERTVQIAFRHVRRAQARRLMAEWR